MLDKPAGKLETAFIEVELEVLSVSMEPPAEVQQSRYLIFAELSCVKLNRLACDMCTRFPCLHCGPPFRRALRVAASVY